MARVQAFSAWRGWLWLLVATIAVHALLPIGSPLLRTNGSPFSAATVDVSTAPRQSPVRIEAEAEDGAPDKASGPAEVEQAIVREPAIGFARPPSANPVAPDAFDIPVQAERSPAKARAPPLS